MTFGCAATIARASTGFDVADYAAHLSKWMTAQHGKLPRHLAADGKFVDEVVGLVSVVDAESGDVVAVAPASRKEGLLSAERTGLWARSPLSDHQAGSAAKVSAKCSAGIG